MIESLLQITIVVLAGLFAAEAFLCNHESRKERRMVERVVEKKYPRVY
jgi:hypothetical protein